ncbi:MAG: S-methyl-5-thioribose-1-phosphate isomerase [Candidatus Eisenbacteria bacterium]
MQEPPVRPIEWCGDEVKIIDQRRLPGEEHILSLRTTGEFAEAIKTLAVRGAPLIGVAAAMGVAVASRRVVSSTWEDFEASLRDSIATLHATRPTASNLFWALSRMEEVLGDSAHDESPEACSDALVKEALRIYEEDLEMGIMIGKAGASLIEDGFSILTHCNAGGLATSGFGTALAPVYWAFKKGVQLRVYADETRPLLQGARLTAWELARAGIDVTVICDSAAHIMLSRAKIDLVLVGADRITSSGDFANKIGTRGVAMSAHAAGVPFYVAAPGSTIDFNLEKGEEIPIEERDALEVTHIGGVQITPVGVPAYNPAFDVTPAEYVSGFITERGLIYPPYRENLASIRPVDPEMR